MAINVYPRQDFMKYLIIMICLVFLIIGCGVSGQDKIDYFTKECDDRNMTYLTEYPIYECKYSCFTEKQEIKNYLANWCEQET